MSIALVTQHANCIRHILSYEAWLTLPYFPTLSHKRREFRIKAIEHKISDSSFPQFSSEKVLILRTLQRDIHARRSSRKVPVTVVRF